MKLALSNLIEVPQNNFKIFKNGSVCYDEKTQNTEVFKEIFDSYDTTEM